jgi:hypothetical protein
MHSELSGIRYECGMPCTGWVNLVAPKHLLQKNNTDPKQKTFPLIAGGGGSSLTTQ